MDPKEPVIYISVMHFRDLAKHIKEQRENGFFEYFTEGSYKQGFYDIVMKNRRGR